MKELRQAISTGASPNNTDLFVQPALRRLFGKIVQDLKLRFDAAREKANAIAAYFQNNFSYSLYQPDVSPIGTVGVFLNQVAGWTFASTLP